MVDVAMAHFAELVQLQETWAELVLVGAAVAILNHWIRGKRQIALFVILSLVPVWSFGIYFSALRVPLMLSILVTFSVVALHAVNRSKLTPGLGRLAIAAALLLVAALFHCDRNPAKRPIGLFATGIFTEKTVSAPTCLTRFN